MLITNGRVVTFGETNEIIENGAVRVDGALMTDVGHTAQAGGSLSGGRASWTQAGSLSCPATSAATPTFMAPLPGAWPSPATHPATFPRSWTSSGGGWTGRCWQRTSSTAPLVCLVDAIKHGTTTLIDHHASPSALEGSLDQIAEAVASRACEPACATR